MANIKDDFALSLIETEQVGFMILQKSFDDTTGEIRFEFFLPKYALSSFNVTQY